MTVTPSALDPKYQDAAKRTDQAATDQMAWNRPNTANPWSAQTSNPDGSVSLGFTGPLAGAQQNLTAQALRSMSGPLDFSQFNSGTGDDFRAQGIAGAQSQMNGWLGPLQGGFDGAERQRLLNAGYAEDSPQFQTQMAKGGGTSADMQSTLQNMAIGMGGERGAKLQGMDLLAKQQGLAEALRQRSLPMEQLSSMQGLLKQPGYDADGSIMGGATADMGLKMNNYWRQRGLAEQEAKDRDDAVLGVFGTAASFIPMGGQLATGAAKGVKASYEI